MSSEHKVVFIKSLMDKFVDGVLGEGKGKRGPFELMFYEDRDGGMAVGDRFRAFEQRIFCLGSGLGVEVLHLINNFEREQLLM